MGKADEHRANAVECRRMADSKQNALEKHMWRDMSASWLDMITNAEGDEFAARERQHVELVNAAFEQGCWRRRPGSSTAAAAAAVSSVAPIARAPASPRTGISPKRNRRRRRRRPHHLRPAPAAPARAGRAGIAPPKIRRARFFGSPALRDKDHERTSRKVGRESTM